MNVKKFIILSILSLFLNACNGVGMLGGGFRSFNTATSSSMEESKAQFRIYGKQTNNPAGLKYPGRQSYLSIYPDAKPVIFGKKSLTLLYESAKKDQKKILEDENYKYYFEFSNKGKVLNSCQFDKKTFDNTKNLIKLKTGLMEPVFIIKKGSLDVSIDKQMTRKLHKELSKIIKIKSLSASLKYGSIIRDYINKETARRGKASRERAEKLIERHKSSTTRVSTSDLFKSLGKITKKDKSSNSSGNEFQSIYNLKFKEILGEKLFSGVSFLVLVNKDNYIVDRLPNFINNKKYNEYYYKKMFQSDQRELDRQTVMTLMRSYFMYERMVLSNMSSLEKGYNYSNVSLNIVSIERLKTLRNSGFVFIPDVKITSTDIQLLDDMLNYNHENLFTESYIIEKKQKCRGKLGSGSLYSQECWDDIASKCDKLWRLNYSKVDQQAKIASKKYKHSLNTLKSVKEKLKLTTGLKGRRLN